MLPWIGIAIETVVLVIAAVWCIASIRGSTQLLKAAIAGLTNEIQGLKVWLGKVDTQMHDGRERLAVVETKVKSLQVRTQSSSD